MPQGFPQLREGLRSVNNLNEGGKGSNNIDNHRYSNSRCPPFGLIPLRNLRTLFWHIDICTPSTVGNSQNFWLAAPSLLLSKAVRLN